MTFYLNFGGEEVTIKECETPNVGDHIKLDKKIITAFGTEIVPSVYRVSRVERVYDVGMQKHTLLPDNWKQLTGLKVVTVYADEI